jgi:hypothetical protein
MPRGEQPQEGREKGTSRHALQERCRPSLSRLFLQALLLPEPPREYELPLIQIEKGPSQFIEELLVLFLA